MNSLPNKYSIRLSDQQVEALEILKQHNVVVSKFIRQAIKEKIDRDWKCIKTKLEHDIKNEYTPF